MDEIKKQVRMICIKGSAIKDYQVLEKKYKIELQRTQLAVNRLDHNVNNSELLIPLLNRLEIDTKNYITVSKQLYNLYGYLT